MSTCILITNQLQDANVAPVINLTQTLIILNRKEINMTFSVDLLCIFRITNDALKHS